MVANELSGSQHNDLSGSLHNPEYSRVFPEYSRVLVGGWVGGGGGGAYPLAILMFYYSILYTHFNVSIIEDT